MVIILMIGIFLLIDGCFHLIKGNSLFIKTSASIKKPILYARITGCMNLLLGVIYTTYYFYKLPVVFMIIFQIVIFYSVAFCIWLFKIRE